MEGMAPGEQAAMIKTLNEQPFFFLTNPRCIRARKRVKRLYVDKNEGVVGCG